MKRKKEEIDILVGDIPIYYLAETIKSIIPIKDVNGAEDIDMLVGDIPNLDFQPTEPTETKFKTTCPICGEPADTIICRKCGHRFIEVSMP
jgi:hypothetical protein